MKVIINQSIFQKIQESKNKRGKYQVKNQPMNFQNPENSGKE